MATITHSFHMNKQSKDIEFNHCYCIGYSGRNQEKAKEHIQELAELGVPEPDDIPALFPLRTSAVSFSDELEVVGNQTSGEAEIVLVFDEEGDIYVTVGSDHTDRGLETVSIQKSKQVCDKPLATELWKLEDVKDHWDKLELSAYTYDQGEETLYQSHSIEAILHVDDLLTYMKEKELPTKQNVVYCGTVPLLEGFKYGDAFQVTLKDPVYDRSITKKYSVKRL
ncbi:DUF2848 domain-containing protein [Pontibacillus yanchengensis]|uniref:DUF2848 domain-containing protein n=1 Tax=Pontibacillus yanchengensis TaxID=462910 RepID=A0ACC7VEM1_9BACI|nr:DUF2848 family protein [Pontibacillus yanchengensis]MYL53893.1 DUF2848 domain-containing protein [Pontibacillus yanchengensis]